MVPKQYRVTRDVAATEAHNFSEANIAEGEILYQVVVPTYGCVDEYNGIALTRRSDGTYPFFEFPRDAVEPVA